eukprot:6826792-Pyramimonas_sp.AAC.2
MSKSIIKRGKRSKLANAEGTLPRRTPSVLVMHSLAPFATNPQLSLKGKPSGCKFALSQS